VQCASPLLLAGRIATSCLELVLAWVMVQWAVDGELPETSVLASLAEL